MVAYWENALGLQGFPLLQFLLKTGSERILKTLLFAVSANQDKTLTFFIVVPVFAGIGYHIESQVR